MVRKRELGSAAYRLFAGASGFDVVGTIRALTPPLQFVGDSKSIEAAGTTVMSLEP